MDVGQLGVEALQHAGLQLGETLGLGVHLLHGDLGGFAQADAKRRRQGARTEAALLAAAHDQRHQTHARLAAHVERADALGAVDLVAGDAHQVDVHRLDVERDLAGGLGRVGVEEGLLLAADLADLGERLDDADLVVHRHDRHDHGLVGDGGTQRVEIDQTVLLHRQVRHLEALLLEMAAGVEHALMLGHRGDDVVPAVLVELGDATDGEVVRLGGARGEDHFLLVGTDQLGDLAARLLDALLGFPAVGMAARMRIAELVGEVRHHRFQHARVERRGGLVIEVDRLVIAPDLGKDAHANPLKFLGCPGLANIRL